MTHIATVLRVDRKRVVVDLPDGRVLETVLRGKVHQGRGRAKSPVAVGDRVRVDEEGEDRGVIVGVEPRTSVLKRPEAGGRWRDQVLVANADRAVLVFAHADPEPHAGLVDRLLVACHAGDVAPLLVFNKCDLETSPEVEALITLYERLGYEVVRASAERNEGVERIAQLFAGRSSVVAGPSGTGKSSLINRVLPGVTLRTGEISRWNRKGQHTTTASQLVRIEGGGHVIDTPGVREFGLRDILPRDLALHFPEFPVPDQCRFLDCAHRKEPACAVLAALDRGAVAPSRHQSYLTLLDEVSEDRRTG